MHSKVETLSSPTASPKRSPSLSMRASVPLSPSRISRVLPLASAISASSSSWVSDTSTSFCSCICTEQSRPPSDTHQRPLPISWISLWRVLSRLSSIRKFRFEPGGSTFDSASTSITAAATCSGRATTRWPLPPPPPTCLKRMRWFGCCFHSARHSSAACACSSSIFTSSTVRA